MVACLHCNKNYLTTATPATWINLTSITLKETSNTQIILSGFIYINLNNRLKLWVRLWNRVYLWRAQWLATGRTSAGGIGLLGSLCNPSSSPLVRMCTFSTHDPTPIKQLTKQRQKCIICQCKDNLIVKRAASGCTMSWPAPRLCQVQYR